MTGLASEWGFVPFAEEADYPKLASFDSAAAPGEAGYRARKSDKRRRQQLEEMVAGVVRLPRIAAGGGAQQSEEAKVATASLAQQTSRQSKKLRRESEAQAEQPAADRAPKAAKPESMDAMKQRTGNAAAPSEGATAPKRKCNKNKFKRDADGNAAAATQGSQDAKSPLQQQQSQPQPHEQQPQKKRRKKQSKPDETAAVADPAADAKPQAEQASKTSKIESSHSATVNTPAASAAAPVVSRKKRARLKRQQRQQQLLQQGSITAEVQTAQCTSADDAAIGAQAQPSAARQQQQQQQPSGGKRKAKTSADGGQSAQPAADRGATANAGGAATNAAGSSGAAAGGSGKAAGGSGSSSKLLDRMRSRLQGGRFRWLNQQLYTTSGDHAFHLMQEQPDLFSQYHEGFRQQAADWPQQPVGAAIEWLRTKPREWAVADFGCGDAQIAKEAAQKVHSFDLVATAPGVVACNMSHTPLKDASVDVAVFCLALMGTDYGAFLQEAHRVLRDKGWLWICEVRSRFAGRGGAAATSGWSHDQSRKGGKQAAAGTTGGKNEEAVMPAFLACLQQLGFKLAQKRIINKMFVILELRKGGGSAGGALIWPPLKSCVYKKQ